MWVFLETNHIETKTTKLFHTYENAIKYMISRARTIYNIMIVHDEQMRASSWTFGPNGLERLTKTPSEEAYEANELKKIEEFATNPGTKLEFGLEYVLELVEMDPE